MTASASATESVSVLEPSSVLSRQTNAAAVWGSSNFVCLPSDTVRWR